MNVTLDLAVIIVTWNVRTLITETLRTLLADLEHSSLKSGVWVVDNQSSDGTVEAIRENFPSVNVIVSPKNLGFAGGNNLALRTLGFSDIPQLNTNPDAPNAVFLLNPDTLTQPGATRVLYDALFRLPRAGLVGAQLSYEDGSFQHGAYHFPGLLQILIDLFPLPAQLYGRLYDSALNGRYNRANWSGDQPFPVDHPLGATMMLKREVIEQTGMFDEQFFMYCEEVDWSLRIKRAGWEVYAVPQARITHLEGRSTTQIKPQSVVNLWTSRFKYYTKHYSSGKLFLARLLVRLGMRIKIRETQRSINLNPDQREALIGAYRKVMTL